MVTIAADVDSSSVASTSSAPPGSVHLLVLIHGMWGHPGHLAELQRIVKETHSKPNEGGERMETLLAETNREDSTYDGIDWGGERVAQEVLDKVKELEDAGNQVAKLSVTGYSLGGLVARYVVGILSNQGFFDKVQPINFNTIATPHIGLPRYPSWVSSLFSALGPKLLSRTGEQFYCADQWSPNGRPLLVVMADPERIFYQALTKFKHVRIYANGINDITVPYVTAAIETEDPFAEHETNGIEITFDEDYPSIVKSYKLPDTPPPPPEKVAMLSRDWFSSFKPRKPILPPALQLRFPLNLLLYTLLPLLIPTAISFALIRFSLASHSSRARIKALEEEHTGSEQQKLIHILAEIEREIEGAAADFIDNPDPSPPYLAANPSSSADKSSPPAAYISPTGTLHRIKEKEHPILSEHQHKIVNWLNTLPGLKKELAFFPDVRNAHAMVISRDVKRFPAHRKGENVIRHWAEHLEI